MNPSRPFILRPVATSLMMVAILLSGIVAYRLLPLSALPEVDYPTIQVMTLYPGASPDVTTSSITAPLERQFGQMPGLNQMSSTSSGGASVITLQFSLALSLDVAEQEVQAAINAASSLLPADLPSPPIYNKVNPADTPILTLAITSTSLPLPKVQDLIDTRIAQKLSQLPGVGLVTLSGGQRPAVRIQANPKALAAYGMSLDDLRTAIGNANVNQAKGSFDGPARASTIDANDQLKSAVEYQRLIIAYKNGAPIRLTDVADVIDDAENVRLAAWSNDKAALILNIQRQPGANVIEVVDRVKKLLPQLQATLPGSVEVTLLTDRFTIISLTFSLIAVLIPLLFMGDVVGRLFREFAITLAVAILISAFVSLTLTPMMCARLLHHTPEDKQSRFYRVSGRFFDNVIERYGRMLDWVLDRQGATLLVAVGTLALTVVLYVLVPKGFFPVQDTGAIQGISEAPQSISFTAMALRQQALAKVVLQDPAVESLSSFIGVDGINSTLNSGRMLINLKPLKVRGIDAAGVIRRLQPQLAQVEGISLYMQPVQDLTIEDRVSRTQYQFTMEDADGNNLSIWVPKLVERLHALPQLADVASDLQDQGLQAYVDIDRSTAARLGVTPAAIDNALYNAFGQRLISTIFTQSNQYRVVLEVHPDYQNGPASLNDIYVTSTDGQQVRLSALARVVEQAGPLSVSHLGQFPAVTISFNLAPGASLGDAVRAIRTTEADIGLPASMQTSFQGAALAFESSLNNTLLLILAAIVTMYIVLGVLYESYIHPITILSTLPSAGVGALLALMLSRTDLGIIASIGIILLMGTAKKKPT